MNETTLRKTLSLSAENFCGFDLTKLDSTVALTDAEWLALELISRVLPLVYDEAELLRQQFAEEADVAYVLQAIKNEGAFYALVHKLNVDVYTGPSSTMAGYAKILKGANILLKNLIS